MYNSIKTRIQRVGVDRFDLGHTGRSADEWKQTRSIFVLDVQVHLFFSPQKYAFKILIHKFRVSIMFTRVDGMIIILDH